MVLAPWDGSGWHDDNGAGREHRVRGNRHDDPWTVLRINHNR